MRRVYLIDGYNLLHQFPELRKKMGVTEQMIRISVGIENVDDLMSVCGNVPGMSKHPAFVEGRKARRQWLLDMIEKFGTVGMLAYYGGSARGFVECIPASAHPMGVFSPDVKRTAVIDCARAFSGTPGLAGFAAIGMSGGNIVESGTRALCAHFCQGFDEILRIIL